MEWREEAVKLYETVAHDGSQETSIDRKGCSADNLDYRRH